MPYILEICRSGDVIEVSKRFSSRYKKKGIPRGNNTAPTSEQMKKINERNSETNLRRTINANFGKGDANLLLTYRIENRPAPEDAHKDIARFLRKMRSYCKKSGKPFKYVQTTEYENTAIHHHLVMNITDIGAIQSIWAHGQAYITLLDDRKNHAKLASYMIKETSKTYKKDGFSGKRYNASKNLIIPKPIKRIVRANSWRKEPKAKAGYILDKNSIRSGTHDYNGYEYQFYSMAKVDKKNSAPVRVSGIPPGDGFLAMRGKPI